MKKRTYTIIGIDEAGRGPLAGPVVVGGVKIRMPNAKLKMLNFCRAKNNSVFSIYHSAFRGIRDSKKLSAKQREAWFSKLTKHPDVAWAVARVYPKTIDRINISQAANLGALRVYRRLLANNESVANKRIRIRSFGRNSLFVDGRALLDGGLRLPAHIPHKTIIKGDEKIPVIAAASIIAKVTRDRIMLRLHKKYPRYHFNIHKGYGTKLHRKLIKKYGRSEVHRKSFRII